MSLTRKFIVLSLLMLSIALLSCSKPKTETKGAGKSGPASITVEVFDRGTDGGKSDPTNNEWTKWIKEKVLKDENIDVTFVRIPRWEEVAAINNMMAAGSPPDICLTYTSELVAQYRDLGGLTDLSPYIDTELKDMKNFLGEDDALPGHLLIRRNQDPKTGAIYAIPARRMNTANRSLFIRKDWCEKLGLALPSTKEEFYNTLVAFRDNDPGNLGKQNVIPFSMGVDAYWSIQNIAMPFIDLNLSVKERWINMVIERPLLLPGFKEGIRFVNKLYNEGLVDRNFPLYKGEEEWFNQTKAGFVGSFSSDWDKIYRESNAVLTDLQKNVSGADLVPINPVEGNRRNAYDCAGVNIFIPKTCKNPEAAMRYINWMARYENYHFLQVGPEGIVHDMINEVPKIKAAAGLWIQNSPQNIDYTLVLNGLDLLDPELTIRGLANAYPWPAERIEEAYRVAMVNAGPEPVIPVTLSAAGPVVQTLIDKSNVLITRAITCSSADFDRLWEEGIKDWLDSGAQAVINERREKYYEP